MLKDIISAQAMHPHQLHLQFEDGVEGTIDLNQIIEFSGVFAPLRDPDYFATVQVDPEIGTIGRSDGVDLDPDVLYAIVRRSGEPDGVQRLREFGKFHQSECTSLTR
jgi:Protein of unknown function (DUF2442)